VLLAIGVPGRRSPSRSLRPLCATTDVTREEPSSPSWDPVDKAGGMREHLEAWPIPTSATYLNQVWYYPRLRTLVLDSCAILGFDRWTTMLRNGTKSDSYWDTPPMCSGSE
jgi:hypothetical protein